MTFEELIARINEVIINPLIILLVALALLVFLFGVVQFIFPSSPEKRSQGSRHMIWGLIGLVISMSVFGIMNLLADTLERVFS